MYTRKLIDCDDDVTAMIKVDKTTALVRLQLALANAARRDDVAADKHASLHNLSVYISKAGCDIQSSD